MKWKNEPATENQLGQLADHPLMKGGTARLIRDADEVQASVSGSGNLAPSAYQLHLQVEEMKRAAAQVPGHASQSPLLMAVVAKRQEFWADTCSDADKMHPVATQGLVLHKKHGCRFSVPTAAQIQTILDSLDQALPFWDRDHPELFYQTLELNFPALLRHQQLGQTARTAI